LLGSAGSVVGDLDVFGDVGVDGREAVLAQVAEALVGHHGVGLAQPMPFEHGEAVLLEHLGGRRGGRTRSADQHEHDSGGDEGAGDRRSMPHQTSDQPTSPGLV
jgi:hypothetical protein